MQTTTANEYVRFEETDSNMVKTPHNFGIQDAKGREIGAIITTYMTTRVEAPVDSCGVTCARKYIGTHFTYRVHATRNNKTYGATQYEVFCKTAEERQEKIEKYLRDARKRALNNLVKQPGSKWVKAAPGEYAQPIN
jgi:hypothetical protein